VGGAVGGPAAMPYTGGWALLWPRVVAPPPPPSPPTHLTNRPHRRTAGTTCYNGTGHRAAPGLPQPSQCSPTNPTAQPTQPPQPTQPQDCLDVNLPCYNGTGYWDSGQHLGNKETYWARHVGMDGPHGWAVRVGRTGGLYRWALIPSRFRRAKIANSSRSRWVRREYRSTGMDGPYGWALIRSCREGGMRLQCGCATCGLSISMSPQLQAGWAGWTGLHPSLRPLLVDGIAGGLTGCAPGGEAAGRLRSGARAGRVW
jgi:hypothetical protein